MDGRESFRGKGGEGKRGGKKGRERKFRGARPQMFFPRTAPADVAGMGTGARQLITIM